LFHPLQSRIMYGILKTTIMRHANYSPACLLIFLVCFASSLFVKAQDKHQPAAAGRNSINLYVGLVEYNINYERNIIQKPRSHSNLRLGYGHAGFYTAGEGNYINPVFVHSIGAKNSFFEINAGLKCMITNSLSSPTFLQTFVPDIFLGYRVEERVKGIIFRSGFSYPTVLNIGFGYKF
jgi:hypothetical protein